MGEPGAGAGALEELAGRLARMAEEGRPVRRGGGPAGRPVMTPTRGVTGTLRTGKRGLSVLTVTTMF